MAEWTLGIETSCDETSAALLRTEDSQARSRWAGILSQDIHRVFGGVVPELASRAHVQAIGSVVERALADAGIGLSQVDRIAVTAGPGLVGALLVGVMYAKTLAMSLDRPFIGVNHLEGHLFAPTLEDQELTPPFVGLLVSGGHTMLLDVPEWGEYRLLGQTLDDAAGEAFDKVSMLLGLGYPGGPAIERMARDGRPGALSLPSPDAPGARARRARPVCVFLQRPQDRGAPGGSFERRRTTWRGQADLARGFQDAAIDVLAAKTVRASEELGYGTVMIGGGVACNRALVAAVRERVAGRRA